MKIMENTTLAPQKHQFGLVIPYPNQGSVPGGGKVPRSTQNHQFYIKPQTFGVIRVKFVQIALFGRSCNIFEDLPKNTRRVAKCEGSILWDFMIFMKFHKHHQFS